MRMVHEVSKKHPWGDSQSRSNPINGGNLYNIKKLGNVDCYDKWTC